MTWQLAKKPLVLCLLMLTAAGLAIAATPTVRLADLRAKIDLETLIPESFGDWTIDRSIVPLMISPDAQAVLDKIYSQTLARTYRDAAGQRVMLSIAYGGDQSDALQVHAPEVCYAAQGFDVARGMVAELVTRYGTLPVKRLTAVKGSRREPITYWITIGERVTTSGIRQKLAQLRYGLTGKIPDGMLVRVSTIGSDTTQAYAVQEQFIHKLLAELHDGDRARVIGRFGA